MRGFRQSDVACRALRFRGLRTGRGVSRRFAAERAAGAGAFGDGVAAPVLAACVLPRPVHHDNRACVQSVRRRVARRSGSALARSAASAKSARGAAAHSPLSISHADPDARALAFAHAPGQSRPRNQPPPPYPATRGITRSPMMRIVRAARSGSSSAQRNSTCVIPKSRNRSSAATQSSGPPTMSASRSSRSPKPR